MEAKATIPSAKSTPVCTACRVKPQGTDHRVQYNAATVFQTRCMVIHESFMSRSLVSLISLCSMQTSHVHSRTQPKKAKVAWTQDTHEAGVI